MLRLLVILVALAAAVLWIEASWSREERVLRLRVRSGAELVEFGRERTVALGQWLVREARERAQRKTPPVGAGGRRVEADRVEAGPEPVAERITRDEQRQLDELIREKTQGP